MSQSDLEIGFIIGTHFGSLKDLSAAIKDGKVSADTILNLLEEAFKAGQDTPRREPLADWEKELLATPTDPKERRPGDVLIAKLTAQGVQQGQEYRVVSIHGHHDGTRIYSVERVKSQLYVGAVPSDYFEDN